MQSTDSFVRKFGNAYDVARRYHTGELAYDQMLALLGLWPYAEITDEDETSPNHAASPGSLAHVIWALDDQFITPLDYVRVCRMMAEHYGITHSVDAVYSLRDDDRGRWQVTTTHAIHILDLDERVVTRAPRLPAPRSPSASTTLRLAAVDTCRVGQHASWTVHVPAHLPGTAITTIVHAIVRIDTTGVPVPRK